MSKHWIWVNAVFAASSLVLFAIISYIFAGDRDAVQIALTFMPVTSSVLGAVGAIVLCTAYRVDIIYPAKTAWAAGFLMGAICIALVPTSDDVMFSASSFIAAMSLSVIAAYIVERSHVRIALLTALQFAIQAAFFWFACRLIQTGRPIVFDPLIFIGLGLGGARLVRLLADLFNPSIVTGLQPVDEHGHAVEFFPSATDKYV